MTEKPVTHVAIVVDRSGSMSYIHKQAITNYNEQIQQMKENSKDQDIFCSLITFNGEVFEHSWDEPANSLEELTESSYTASGSTALLDAMGYTIKKLQETTTPGDNVAYLVIVITDGEENTSSHFSNSAINEMVESCQATGKWTFTYMGCSGDYLKKLAKSTGVPLANCAMWSNDSAESADHGFHMARRRTSGYYGERVSGLTSSSNMYSDSSESLADFTTDDVVIPSPTSPDVFSSTPNVHFTNIVHQYVPTVTNMTPVENWNNAVKGKLKSGKPVEFSSKKIHSCRDA